MAHRFRRIGPGFFQSLGHLSQGHSEDDIAKEKEQERDEKDEKTEEEKKTKILRILFPKRHEVEGALALFQLLLQPCTSP